MNIAVIGIGRIAEPLVNTLAAQGHTLFISQRSLERAKRLTQAHPNVQMGDNQQALAQSSIVFLALMPDVAAQIIPHLEFNPQQTVISLMADVSLDDLQQWVAPATVASVMIPYPFLDKGQSPILQYPGHPLLTELFGEENTLITVKRSEDLSAYLVAQGILASLLTQIQKSRDWLAGRTGDPETAEAFLRMLVSGFLKQAPIDQGIQLETMLESINTEGGYNATLAQWCEQQDVFGKFVQGLEVLEQQSKA